MIAHPRFISAIAAIAALFPVDPRHIKPTTFHITVGCRLQTLPVDSPFSPDYTEMLDVVIEATSGTASSAQAAGPAGASDRDRDDHSTAADLSTSRVARTIDASQDPPRLYQKAAGRGVVLDAWVIFVS